MVESAPTNGQAQNNGYAYDNGQTLPDESLDSYCSGLQSIPFQTIFGEFTQERAVAIRSGARSGRSHATSLPRNPTKPKYYSDLAKSSKATGA